MIGIVIELIISWFLLWLFAKKNLEALGFMPTRSRIINLSIGLLVSGICCIIYHLLKIAFVDNSWILNHEVSGQIVLKSTWWTFKSVISEELLFRGAILYLLIKAFGAKTACTFSGVAFGVYHLFSYNVIGNPVQMTIVFLMTGIFGVMLAYSFARTQSLYLPVALHFGWNWFNIVIFSSGPLGSQLLVKANTNQLQGIGSIAILLFQVGALPFFTFCYLNYIARKQKVESL